ncbi:MAG: sel1 repeat family protein [Solobacterium sp.]|nr:sel1 repeat family protein [Solobacterium sp.]
MKETQVTQTTDQSAEALLSIGEVYYRGIGVNKDYDQAFKFFQKAANMGHPNALCKLGNCYSLGHGTSRNLDRAFTCYEDASDEGDIEATWKLGDFYWNGTSRLIQKDVTRACDYYLDALTLTEDAQDPWNAPEVYLRVANCLKDGAGITRDVRNAYLFYRSAIDGFLDRIDSGDTSCEMALEEAEDGALACQKILNQKD